MAMSNKDLTAAIRAPFFKRHLGITLSDTGFDYAYDNNFSVTYRNAADTANIPVLRLDTSDQVRVGPGYKGVKVFNRPTTGVTTTMTDAFALQVKSEFTGTAAGHACVEATADWKGNGAAGGGNIAVQGVSRVASTFTMGGGTLIGAYGQVKVDGAVSGAGAMIAGVYSLIEDGGTWTAVDHVASLWVDSHLTKTVSAGSKDMIYITNNGVVGTAPTQLDNVFYIHPGNKITNLFTLAPNFAGGMVSANTAGAISAITNWRTIKVVIEGETHYLIAAKGVA